jgi:hypothetical protein
VITRSKYVHIIKLVAEDGTNPLDYGKLIAYKLTLNYHCSKLYNGAKMTFMDTAIINKYTFVLGHPKHLDKSEHNGVVLYRLAWYVKDETWKDCTHITGSSLVSAGWVDGSGEEAKFLSTPHNIAVLPSLDSLTIIVGDFNNHALQYVNVTIPVKTHDQTNRVCISSVAYDKDLYQVLYTNKEPWTGGEILMAIFDVFYLFFIFATQGVGVDAPFIWASSAAK